MLVEKKITEFIELLASDSPAPGGGSTVALAGALGAALVSMVTNLTLGREKFAGVEDDMKNIRDAAADLQQKLLKAVDEDKAAFDQVMAAYKLPRETAKEKEIRQEAIEKALKCAASIPLEVARYAYEVLQLSKTVAEKGNPNAVSDAGVAALLADAAAKGAILNVKINLSSIKDKQFARDLGEAADSLFVKCEMLKNKVVYKVESML